MFKILRLLTATALLGMVVVAFPPTAQAQVSSSTGWQVTDFQSSIDVPGFDSSLGRLVAAEVAVTAEYRGTVDNVTNESGELATFTIGSSVKLCAQRSDTGPVDHASCSAGGGPTTLTFDTPVVDERFADLPVGASAASEGFHFGDGNGSRVILEGAALAGFIDVPSVGFSVASEAGFTVGGGGGNARVRIITEANITVEVIYQYAGVSVTKLTNGGDDIVVEPGDPVEWTYDVTNDGNTVLIDVDVVDDLEGHICTIASLAPGATDRCTKTGVAGDAPYSNVATVTGHPEVNPTVEVTDEDPSGYRPPEAPPATPTPAPSPTPTETDGTDETVRIDIGLPQIDIELATNGEDADTPTGPSLELDDPVTWTYVVTNTGSVDLYQMVVNDDRIPYEVCTIDFLAIAHSTTCTLTGIADTEGQYSRTGDVEGWSARNERVTDVDPTHHIVEDDVLGIVVETAPAPSDPDEVLALTGDSGNTPATVALIASGLGLVALSASEALRRRHAHSQDQD